MDKLGIQDLYAAYCRQHPDHPVGYLQFTETIRRFNRLLIERILDGATFYMGHRLGSLRIKRIRRDHSRPAIDWGETNKLKALGIRRLVYFTDDYYFTWYWAKYRCSIPNRSVYSFEPSKGQNGAVKKLVRRLRSDEFAPLNYLD